MKLVCALAAWLLLATSVEPDVVSGISPDGRQWAAALRDPKLRDEAACRLLTQAELRAGPVDSAEPVPDNGCSVSRVVDNTGRPDGVTVVFLEDSSSPEKLRDGTAGGHFVLFDANGRLVDSFMGANVLGEDGGVVKYRTTGDVAIVDRLELGGFTGFDASMLYVVPATTGQRVALAIVVGAPTRSDGKQAGWSWRARDVDHDGTVEFEIGPIHDGSFTPKAVYRYSSATGLFQGPEGSPAGDFYLLPASNEEAFWGPIREFVRAHGGKVDCDPDCKGPMRSEETRELRRQFEAARRRGESAQADALLRQLAGQDRLFEEAKEDLANYWIFDRGHCDVDFLPADSRENFLHFNQVLTEGILACEAAKLPLDASDAVRSRMTALLDSRVNDWQGRGSGLYDAFARQGTINRRALQLLASYHLDDPRFDRDGESALIEQIRAGRFENVRTLLDAGYDANSGVPRIWHEGGGPPNKKASFKPAPTLPLQAVRESLATQGERAVEIARLLIARGADPGKLRWYPHFGAAQSADAALQLRLDKLFSEAPPGDAISAEFHGLIVESSPELTTTYARFLLGNGSSRPLSLQAWRESGEYELGGLNSQAHLEKQLPGGTQWDSPVMIEDGWSPSTRLEIAPGGSHEVLFEISYLELLTPDAVRYRLWINNYPGEIHSEPFNLRDPRYPVVVRSLPHARDWLGIKPGESPQMTGVDEPLPSDDPRMAGLPEAAVQRLHAAARAIRDGQAAVAERALQEALALSPGHPEALRILGIHHTRAGRATQALAVLRDALAQWPDDALLHTDLGSAHNAAGEIEAAIASWRRACELAPDHAMGWFNLGRNLQLRGESAQAVDALQRAAALSPEMWPASVLLGDALVHLGRFEEAAASYRAVLALQPSCGEAWRGLGNIKTQPLSPADREQMQALLAQPGIAENDRIAIGFALGKCCEDSGDPDAAFAAIAEANARQDRLTPWRAQAFHEGMVALVDAGKLLPRPRDAALGSEVIFIVGMPRSGSTLFEQILAAHPQVEGASELDDLSNVLADECRRRRLPLLQWVRAASAADWQRLGNDYLARTARWRRARQRHTDKMPENWRYAGLLRAMLPGAKIVDARRDRIESGWSCFKQQFYSQPHFANTLEGIAAYRHDYEVAMDAWREHRPGAIRLQSYEALLADPETQVRELLAFCELPFDAGCLQFHRAERSVRTASAAQVRQPLQAAAPRARLYGHRLDALRQP